MAYLKMKLSEAIVAVIATGNKNCLQIQQMTQVKEMEQQICCETNNDLLEESSPAEEYKNYEPRLNQEWVQILINLRMKHAKSFTRKRHSAAEAWKIILHEMKELGAPSYVTIDKIKKKWMNLIARYKLLKFSSHSSVITWPYFDQLNRAYSRNPSIVELRKSSCLSKKDSESEAESFVSDYADSLCKFLKKQKFTSILIQLRFAYRHLFTGKKYAAQRGWMVIQNMLPGGQSYSIEQISKCWQNLVQRYRTLLEGEKDLDKISWVHFKKMNEIMTQGDSCDAIVESGNEAIKKELQSLEEDCNKNANVITFDSQQNEIDLLEPGKETVAPEVSSSDIVKNALTFSSKPFSRRGKKRMTSSLDQLLDYFVRRDEIQCKRHEELVSILKSISEKLRS